MEFTKPTVSLQTEEDASNVTTSTGDVAAKSFCDEQGKSEAKTKPLKTKKAVAAKNPVRVEPKSYFANERTFIQWISAALLLVTVAVILLNKNTAESYVQVSATFMCSFAVVVVIYALFVYHRRVKLLESGSAYGYVDHTGPTLLALILIVGLGILLKAIVTSSAFPRRGSVAFLSQENGLCYQHDTTGFSQLVFEPSDLLVDTERNVMLVVSGSQIASFPLIDPRDGSIMNNNNAGVVVSNIPGADLEALTAVNGTIYAIGEVNSRTSIIYALRWNSTDENLLYTVNKWEVDIPGIEGATHIPAGANGDGRPGQLYLAGVSGGSLEYGIASMVPPNPDTAVEQDELGNNVILEPDYWLNRKVHISGLVDGKIGSMAYFESVLYVLHDNEQLVRSWDLKTGVLLAEWVLPRVTDDFQKQWEGLAFSRSDTARSNNLRAGSPPLTVHLSLDSPAQIWSFAVDEPLTPGHIVLPNCAAAVIVPEPVTVAPTEPI